MSKRFILNAIITLLALYCWFPHAAWCRSGSISVDYPASNAVINKQSGAFNAGIGYYIAAPYTGVITPGTYCGPGYPAYNPDPQWYGRVEQLDYYNDASSGSILANLKYRVDGGANASFADIRLGDNQIKVATINLATLSNGSHSAAFDAYGVYSERCAYPSSCTTCHGNTYVSSPWVRKEGGLFAQSSLAFRVITPVSGSPTLSSPAHRTFVSPSWVGADSVNFVWSTVTNATNYTLNITDGSNLNISRDVYTTSYNTGSDSSIILQRGRKYSWTVAAGNELGYGTPSAGKQFIIGSAECWPEFSGTRQSHIDTCYKLNSNPEIYELKDISRQTYMDTDGHKGAMGSDNAIITQVGSFAAGPLTNTSNSWTAGGTQNKAIDAHVNAAKVYDYFYDPLLSPQLDRLSTPRRFSRNSFDGNGGSMVSIVENPDAQCGTESACFISINNTNSVNFDPGSTDSGAIDIVTHEWAHAVTATTSQLGGWNEPGALNEAFSDWLAIAHKQARGSTSWEVIQGGGSVLRNVADPARSGQPVIYQKNGSWTNDYKDTLNWGSAGEIHKNAGVPNKMFYLLSSGGNNYEVDVQRLGIDRAMQIAFRANSIGYWSSIFSLSEAKTKMVQAAQDLSATPNEINQIKLAWAAVGVGDLPKITTSVNTSTPLAGATVAYRENAKIPLCTEAHATCIAAKRYKFSCSCISESYYSAWDKRVTVEATSNPGYSFLNWTEDNVPVSSSPTHSFNVTGDVNLVANFSATPAALSTAASLGDFQSIATSTDSLEHTFVVINSGAQPVTVTSVQLAGANPADFSVTANGCSGSLPSAGSCSITAKFAPSTAGAKSASLVVSSTDSISPSYVIALSGQAGSPVVASAAGSLDGIGYSSIQNAYNAVATDNEIRLLATNFNETLNFNRSVTATIRGGYNGNFTDAGGKSALQGALTIGNGTVIVDGLQIGGSSYHSALSVVIDSPGAGTVTSSSGAINCTGSCTSSFINGDQITLTAASSGDSVFTGWSGGGCSGTGSCTVTLSDDIRITASFRAAKIAVAPASESLGNVFVGTTTAAQTITVTSSGTQDLIIGALSLTGTDAAEFATTGDTCSNRTLVAAATCTVQITFSPTSTGAKTASLEIPSNDPLTPVFNVPLNGIGSLPTVTVSKSGIGAGTVTSSPAGIDCGSACTATFALNTAVALSALPDAGYVFSGWSGACSGTGDCIITIAANTNVTASFADMPLAACSANPVKLGGTLYSTIQAAYNAAVDGDLIKLLAIDITESFSANRNIAVIIDGGYKCSFASNPLETVIHGDPEITSGDVTLTNITIDQ